MPLVGFESTVPVSARPKTVHASATVTGAGKVYSIEYRIACFKIVKDEAEMTYDVL
jgi:hypothetical protein